MINIKWDKSIYNSKDPSYIKWQMIMKRCLSEEYKEEHPAYKDCTIYRGWKNYHTFGRWYYNNIYQCGDEEMAIDKDILVKGNKEYHPSTCIFVPKTINNLFSSITSNGELRRGIYKNKTGEKYIARIGVNGKVINLGTYETLEEAFAVYKIAKEERIRQVADEYMEKYPDVFPKKLYDAMYNYKIEIDD